jgi:hypothetical protein
MSRQYFLDLARRGLRMPIGTDLVLHEHADAAAILLDGPRLGQVYIDAARRYRTPLALALMDLRLEKDLICARLGVPEAELDTWHFAATPDAAICAQFSGTPGRAVTPRTTANCQALAQVRLHADLLAVGMVIGPFSLMTKLLAEPITPVYMAGSGVTAAVDPEVACVETVLELATQVCLESVRRQAAAGAQAILVAEPAASAAYLSPKQLAAGSGVFERYALAPNRRLAAAITAAGMDFMFHCCGDLVEEMVRGFATLRPVLLSLGSSRRLWEDARLVHRDTVLYGNLPSKRFIATELSPDAVAARSEELLARMAAVGHPFILGSECDVLHVPGHAEEIHAKVNAMLTCGCPR